MDGPFLWYLNRGTGLVLLALLTLTAVAGVLAGRGRAGGRVPRFLTQTVHRDLALVGVALLTAHVASAVADTYVDIRWWQAFVPVGASYRPFWLGLGAATLDVLLVIVVTSLLRHRLPLRAWRALHLTAYAAWGLAVAHGIGIGTDTGGTLATWVYAGSAGAVGLALAIRLTGRLVARLAGEPAR